MKRAATTFTLLLGLAACGGGDGSGGDGGVTGANHPLAGMINGMAWTAAAGQTDSFLSMDQPTFVAFFYDVPIDTSCSIPTASDRAASFNIPRSVGNHPLSLGDATISYYVGNNTTQGYPATAGYINVTELTATTIRGSAKAAANAANTVEGTFEVTICP
jgi:hypothetical protein